MNRLYRLKIHFIIFYNAIECMLLHLIIVILITISITSITQGHNWPLTDTFLQLCIYIQIKVCNECDSKMDKEKLHFIDDN